MPKYIPVSRCVVFLYTFRKYIKLLEVNRLNHSLFGNLLWIHGTIDCGLLKVPGDQLLAKIAGQ